MNPRDRRISFSHSCWCASNSWALPLRTRNVTRSTIISALLTGPAGPRRGGGGENNVGADLDGMIEHGDPADIEVDRHRPVAESPDVLDQLRQLEFRE